VRAAVPQPPHPFSSVDGYLCTCTLPPGDRPTTGPGLARDPEADDVEAARGLAVVLDVGDKCPAVVVGACEPRQAPEMPSAVILVAVKGACRQRPLDGDKWGAQTRSPCKTPVVPARLASSGYATDHAEKLRG